MKRRILTLKENDKAVLNLPLKLLITIILISCIIPTSLIGYKNLERSRFEIEVKNQIKDMLNLAVQLNKEGNGSSTVFTLNLQGGTFSKLDYINIGGPVGEEDYLIKYKFSWKNTQNYYISDNPTIHMTSINNESLTLGKGIYDIKLTNVYERKVSYIVFSIIN